MKSPSLEAKKAYCTKTRQSNYLASLRLEGVVTSRPEAGQVLPTKEAVLKRYRQVKP